MEAATEKTGRGRPTEFHPEYVRQMTAVCIVPIIPETNAMTCPCQTCNLPSDMPEERRQDAQVSRQIFGAVVKTKEDGTIIASIDPDAEETWIDLPHHLTNDSDDAQVFKAIRDAEHDGCPIVNWEAFVDALYDEAMGVVKVAGHRSYEAVAGYVVGAYSRAALTAAGDDKMDEPQSPVAWLRGEVDADANSPAALSTQ